MSRGNMLTNKKAQFFWYIVLFGSIVIIVMALFYSPKPSFNYIGEKPLNIINTSLHFEKLLHYIDQSAKLSSYKSIYDLSNSGGFKEKEKCGKFLDYNLWNNKDKKIEDCFPDYENNFKYFLDKNLKEYLTKHPEFTLSINYNYILTEDKLIAIAQNDITGDYSIKPNFKTSLDFDLNIFKEIKEQAKELIQNCSKKKDDELSMCILLKTKTFTPTWELIGITEDHTERKFKFEVNTNKTLFPFEKNVIIKFALYLPEPTI